jgi:two-component system nitrogen regulation response regulator GlnG
MDIGPFGRIGMSMLSWFQGKEAEGSADEVGLENIVELKMDTFFERMGEVEASSVHRAVIAQVERPLIRKCLEWAGGNKLKAARVLGINRNTLSKKVKEYGIE